MANQTKIPGWKLPGAVGWEGWIENEPKNHLDPAKPVMSAVGHLSFRVGSFIVNEAPATLEAISGVFTDYIFQGEKIPALPKPEEQEQKAQAIFIREHYERQTANANALQTEKAQALQETVQRITNGQTSAAEVIQEVGITEVGVNHVVFLWNQRLQKMEAAKLEKASQEMKTTTGPVNLTNRLDAQEGQSTIANAIAGAG